MLLTSGSSKQRLIRHVGRTEATHQHWELACLRVRLLLTSGQCKAANSSVLRLQADRPASRYDLPFAEGRTTICITPMSDEDDCRFPIAKCRSVITRWASSEDRWHEIDDILMMEDDLLDDLHGDDFPGLPSSTKVRLLCAPFVVVVMCYQLSSCWLISPHASLQLPCATRTCKQSHLCLIKAARSMPCVARAPHQHADCVANVVSSSHGTSSDRWCYVYRLTSPQLPSARALWQPPTSSTWTATRRPSAPRSSWMRRW